MFKFILFASINCVFLNYLSNAGNVLLLYIYIYADYLSFYVMLDTCKL